MDLPLLAHSVSISKGTGSVGPVASAKPTTDPNRNKLDDF